MHHAAVPCGLHVQNAASWEDGKDYRLLVLDIEMGGMNGLGLAEKVRLEDREVPILFVTGYDEYIIL